MLAPIKACALLLAALAATPAVGQSLTPMEMAIGTYTDRFILRLEVRNPYPDPQQFQIYVWNPDGSAVTDARLSRPRFGIAPGGMSPLVAEIPMRDGEARSVYVCVQSSEFRTADGAGVKGQVCGRYHGLRRRSQPASRL